MGVLFEDVMQSFWDKRQREGEGRGVGLWVVVIVDICTNLSSPPIPHNSKSTARSSTTGLASLRVLQRSRSDRTKIQKDER